MQRGHTVRTGNWRIRPSLYAFAAPVTRHILSAAHAPSTACGLFHIFPKAYLQQELGASKGLYNQVANYAFLEKRMNIAIGKRAPRDYCSRHKRPNRPQGHVGHPILLAPARHGRSIAMQPIGGAEQAKALCLEVLFRLDLERDDRAVL